MYKIIGADQKEYGPINADQLRQWIAEGRLGAQTSVQAEGGEWRPLQTFPEFAEALAAKGANLAAVPGAATAALPANLLDRDYDLDIGSCIARSWELVKKNFWPVVGITLLIMFISAVVNQVIGLFSGPAIRSMILHHRVTAGGLFIVFLTSLLSQPIYSVLMGGLLKYYLKLIRGEPAGLGDAFAGFSSAFVPLVLLGLTTGFLSWIGYCLCLLPGIYLAVAWFFATPLVIDRQLGFWQAMESSRRAVSKHWFVVFGLLLVAGLIAIGGVLACCIGVLVTIPIGSVAMMYAYEDIFSASASKTS